MRLVDRIGLAARTIDNRILDLIKDVQVLPFNQAIRSKESLHETIVIGDDTSLSETFLYLDKLGLSYLVQKKHEYYLYNLLMNAMIQKYPDIFLRSPMTLITKTKDIGSNNIVIPFDSTADKARVVEEADKFVSQNSTNSSIRQNIHVIISELFSNAMYSAPTDENGSYLFANHARNVEVVYPHGLKGEILLSFNNEIFAVACRDPFGSVNKVRVTKRLHQVFDDGKLAVVEHAHDQTLGSGLGLKLIIENSIGFGMVVKQGKETFVFAILPVGSGNRKISRISKNICFKFY